MYPIIERFAEDSRDAVIQCLLYSRDNKEGWLDIYTPGRSACEDGGALFMKMVRCTSYTINLVNSPSFLRRTSLALMKLVDL